MDRPPTKDDYIAQFRFRIDEAERLFREGMGALQRSQAAGGALQSGETVIRALQLLDARFSRLTDDVLEYLQKFVTCTGLAVEELLPLTSQELLNSLSSFNAIVDRNKLLSFASGRGVETRIDEAFERVLRRLSLRVRDFELGLYQGGITPLAPAANRYVRLDDNRVAETAPDLGALKEAIRGDNETDEELKEIALYEISVFEAALVPPLAATDLIQRFVDMVLGWIKRTFTAAAVQEVAQRLIQALLKLLS
jgi:hypothetical protein